MTRFFVAFETSSISPHAKKELYHLIEKGLTTENITIEETVSGVIVLGMPKNGTTESDVSSNEKTFTQLLKIINRFPETKPHFTTRTGE